MRIEEINNDGLAFIIQARVGSTRLPHKMTLPFYKNLSIFEIIINKLINNFPNINIILATSINEENDVLVEKALLKGCVVFRGDENDVLKRIYDAAINFQISRIIRVCADNPFLDILELKRLLLFINDKNLDYASFLVNGIPSIKTHFGFWAEYVTSKALLKVMELTQEVIYHEHVTNYIYENQNLFNLDFIMPNPKIKNQNNIRMTLDTINDYKILSHIYLNVHNLHGKNFGIDEIISYLSDNKTHMESMLLEINKNFK